MKRLLVLSNNVLSNTRNNGKTLYSFIEGLKDVEIYQLYLSGEIPQLDEYSYFRISDRDIIKGMVSPKKRGHIINNNDLYEGGSSSNISSESSMKGTVGKNSLTMCIRDILWYKHWMSPQLNEWLEGVNPDAVFFVGGDGLFAYKICNYIVGKYKSRLTLFITDDYVMPRKNESYLAKFRRRRIIRSMKTILEKTSCFYTISEQMRQAYKEVFGKDSSIIVNASPDLQVTSCQKKEKDIVMTYAGSFYYKRSDVLGKLALSIKTFNERNLGDKAILLLYSNSEPTDEIRNVICIEGGSRYEGSLNRDELVERLNTSDYLVFVESFDEAQIEKVQYSLSTKIPEYLSVGKAIIAIGPEKIGSMDYLQDVAICITDPESIQDNIHEILMNKAERDRYSQLARNKYLLNHNVKRLQNEFYRNVFGIEEDIT